MLEIATKLSINLPDSERGLTRAQVARYDQLRRRLLRTDLKPRQRNAALDELENMELAIRRAQDTAWQAKTNTETAELAANRGESVEWSKTGSLRIMSRAGLKQAYQDGHLEPDHGSITSHDIYEAGKRYRDVYEVAEGQSSGEKGTGGFGPKAPQVRKMEAGLELLAMRARLTERQRAVLDLVCGQEIRLRDAATQLRRGFPSTRNSLRGGLTALVGLKIEMPENFADKLKAKTAAIVAAQNAA